MQWIVRAVGLSLLLVAGLASAESVKDLPKPTSYVSDLAGVLDASTKQQMEQLCGEVDHQAHAQIAVVTIHSLGDQSIDDFAADLEQKWGVGKKGTDRGVLMLFSMDEHKDRIEVGYGLEGILNDAKVGDILRAQRPLMQQGQYSEAIQGDLQQVSEIIAGDAGVTLTQPHHTYHRERVRNNGGPVGTFLKIGLLLLVLWIIFRRRGGGGYGGGGGGGFWPGLFIGSLFGGSRSSGWGGGSGWSGGGSGWSGGDDGGGNDSGGFGGFDGGSSGGGGASGDW
jgi:uncharacterized protein